MLLNLSSFFRSILPSFSKSDVESDLEISIENISSVIDSYKTYEEIEKVIKPSSDENKDVLKQFYKELDVPRNSVKLTPNKLLSTDTVNLFLNVKVNAEWMLNIITESINDVIVSQALTAYHANLLRAVPHVYFLTRYATDLLNFLYVQEAESTGQDLSNDYKLNKKQKEFIKKNVWVYARLLSVYGLKHDDFKDKLSGILDIVINKDNVEETVSAYSNSKIDLFSNLPSGFVGSPIYTVRLIFAQWEADRYRSMKDKRKLLELRLLHLKLLKEQGKADVQLEKEISYLQSRITNLDYKLAKIEESVE